MAQPDLIHGFAAIAEHLGITPKAARRRAEKGTIPTFRMGHGTSVYARRSEIDSAVASTPPVRRGRPPRDDSEERRVAAEARRAERRAEVREIERLRKERALADLGASGLLYGIQDIAGFLGVSIRQAKHLQEQGYIPTFKMGARVCARRKGLQSYLAQLERGVR